MLDLTVVILTKNEENNLEKCIHSLGDIAKHVVVVDSYSTDGTVELAKRLSADVFYGALDTSQSIAIFFESAGLVPVYDHCSMCNGKIVIGDRDHLKTKAVVIGRNIFIGYNSSIFKGTLLGDKCVVGVGSVVSGNSAGVVKKL